ncbi:trypsin-like peptidase domain-containing protein [Ramlibacter albus]|uniref:Probable periplasmic serine endoprotease DegP-like n=1 Tax=Ramlibacter albus TaxID=2079448 RepID=A0A923S4A8_9BURK|nr:trypsin-like peptidase domain-containing protein [Ramlibacter albus]MBC5763942.1 trypsin-like peptidase domain-containing protein [Ramlibacter albus]
MLPFLLATLLLAAAPAAALADECGSRATARTAAEFGEAVSRLAPAVVTLRVLRPPRADDEVPGLYAMSGLPLPGGADGREPALERSFSSGFVIGADGWIVSTAHAVYRAQQAFVELADGRQLPARVVGSDLRNDVALLKVQVSGLPVADIAADVQLCAGDALAALGSPFGFERTVTSGVVSAPLRQLPGVHAAPLIQTDVALNPGSSGGPLFDTQGRVVGMSSMIYSDTGIYVGVSFAVPIARVLKVAAALRQGRYPQREMGIVTQPLTAPLAEAFGLADSHGVLVANVRAGSAAALSGLRPGDVVLGAGGAAVDDEAALEDAVAAAPGGVVRLQVWRGRSRHVVAVRTMAGSEPSGGPPQREAEGPERRLGLGIASAAATQQMPAGVYVERAAGSGLLAGLEPGDRITAVNGTDVTTPDAFDAALDAARDRDVVALLVWRNRAPLYIAVRRIAR